jgi:hypothetical protein
MTAILLSACLDQKSAAVGAYAAETRQPIVVSIPKHTTIKATVREADDSAARTRPNHPIFLRGRALSMIRGVRMVKQNSDSTCQQDYSWGFDRNGIWVDHGCRGDFVGRSLSGKRTGQRRLMFLRRWPAPLLPGQFPRPRSNVATAQ